MLGPFCNERAVVFEYRNSNNHTGIPNVTLKTDLNFPQAIATAALVALLVVAVLFCVAFEEQRDADGNPTGLSKPVFNFHC